MNLERIVSRLEREGLLASERPLADADADRRVLDVTTDSRQVVSGALFCAVRGSAGDGHRFLGDAAASGAVAALVETPDPQLSIPQVQVTQGRLAAAVAAAEFFEDPWSELVMVGVTGTNGKTTTVSILRHLLGTRQPAASIGTLGAVGPDGRVLPGSEGLTTPGPVEFARMVRRLRDDGVGAIAMEASSHALEQRRLAAARFDVAIFTNLSRDHLDYHATVEAYRAAKLLLIDLLEPTGTAVVNADDAAWRDVSCGARTVRYGMVAKAEVAAEDLVAHAAGMEWTLRTPDGSALVRLPLYGTYNVANALAAAACLWSLGWTVESIAEALAGVPQVPGRLERVPGPEGAPTVVIDFAHTPDAIERALDALRPLTRGRLILVFGAGGDRDRGKRPEMGRVAAVAADLTIVTSDNPRHEDPEAIADEIESGMGSAPRRRIIDRAAAIRFAIESASADDIVLLAGKGHETYQIWGDEKRPFDERAIVAETFSGRAGSR